VSVSRWADTHAALRDGGSTAIPHNAYGGVNVNFVCILRACAIEAETHACIHAPIDILYTIGRKRFSLMGSHCVRIDYICPAPKEL
jgi:hypothetical protein